MAKFNLSAKINEVKGLLKSNWNKPNKGEYLSIKEVTAYGASQVGSFVYATVVAVMVFGSNYFCGSIMKINNIDFTKIALISTIVNYALIFLNPLGVLIYENHGKLEPKTKRLALIVYFGELIVGLACYFLPMNMFESIPKVGMIAFPQIVGNILTTGAIGNLLTWLVRSKFGTKFGRMKPFILIYGVPSAILMSIIPFMGLENQPYAIRLILLHLSFTMMSYFFNLYNVIGGMVNFMTPNSQERQRLFSIVPIVTSLIPSIIGMFFPMLIQLTGGYRELKTYQVFVPIFSCLGVAISFFVLKCKERIIEKTDGERPKVTFWKGAKQVLKNKYLWIIQASNILASLALAYTSILQWWFVYSLRMEWFYGIAANIVVLSMTAGNLLTPFLTKRMDKKWILIAARALSIGTVLIMYLSINVSSIVLFMFAMFLRNAITPVETGVYSGLNADVMDYHQWRFGERADNMSSVFSWFLSPITMLIGFIMPLLQQVSGFTSDWDMLYNPYVLNQLFILNIFASVISSLLSIFPIFFYDLTRDKHSHCIEELKERVQGHTDIEDFIKETAATTEESI